VEILPKDITTKFGESIQRPEEKKESSLPGLEKIKSSIEGIKNEDSPWPLILASALLVLVLLAYGGLYFYRGSIEKEIESLNAKKDSMQTEENNSNIEKVLGLSKSLSSAKGLLSPHVYSSNSVRMIEDLTSPDTGWSSFSFDYGTGKVSMKGKARTYSEVAKQILIFENDPEKRMSGVAVSGISLDKAGGVSFSCDLTLNKNYLKKFIKQ
jgi:hypothetical protein